MDKLALFALHSVPGMGSAMLRRLVARFGDPGRAIACANRVSLAQIPRMTRDMADHVLALPGQMAQCRRQLDALGDRGDHMVSGWEEGMHPRLSALRSPPAILYMRGRIPKARYCAIVGTTEPSRVGSETAEAMAAQLAEAGWVVASGFARGIDTAAHRGALAAGGSTVMFIPTGIDHFSLCPRLAPHAGEIGRRAVVVSEFFPTRGWSVPHAMARNRLVAGISDALLVVEAKPEGGTMATFRMARRARVPTFAVLYDRPAASATGNALAIAQGAEPVRGPGEVGKILATPRRERLGQPTLW